MWNVFKIVMENVATNPDGISTDNHRIDIEDDYSEKDSAMDFERRIKSKYEIAMQRLRDRFICYVDPLLIQVNDGAYRPNFFNIGPLRKTASVLVTTEAQKRIYLKDFLERPEKKAGLKDFFELISKSAEKIHDCYEQA